MVLEGRLTDCAEQGGLRAIGQSGFRRGFCIVGIDFYPANPAQADQKKGTKAVLLLCGLQEHLIASQGGSCGKS